MKARKVLAAVLISVLATGGFAQADTIEWLGNMAFRPLSPTLNYWGVLYFSDKAGNKQLGVDTSGDITDSNGVASINIAATTSAVNNLKVVNSVAGSAPSIAAVGADTNIGITFTPKGTGSVVLNGPVRAGGATSVGFDGASNITDNNSVAVINLGTTTSAVNNAKVANAATGSNPVISAIGTDVNIGLTLTPKGTGSVVLNGPVRAGGATSIGFDGASNITDNNSVAAVNIASTASAVNNLKVTNAATGNSPDLAVIGTDANVSGTLTPKGTGIWTFGSSGTVSAVAGAATLNTQLGVVTSESLTTAAGATYTLTLTDSKIAATSRIFVSTGYGTSTTGSPAVMRVQPAAGSATIIVQNIHASAALNGTITISFLVL